MPTARLLPGAPVAEAIFADVTARAAKLRERGIDAVAIAGGIGTWRANGLPTEPLKEKEGEAS